MGEELVGRRFGDYEILGVIGRGGMGVVYEARQISTPREIALKIPHESLESEPEFLRRFELEGRTAQRVHHPNVVETYAVGREGDVHYIAMERVRGRPLTMIIRKEVKLDAPRALRIARQVASALAAIHETGFVHRDVKPDNLLVDDQDRVKLMDFGIARPVDREQSGVTENSEWNGTSIYLAPELCDGGKPSPASDIYALGAVLNEMVAGRPPFAHADAAELRRMILETPPPDVTRFNPTATEDVQLVLDMALAKDPSDRFATAEEMIEEIDAALASLVEA